MPADDRISALLDALSGDLSQEKPESLGREFDSLAQDRPETLVFFVLEHVCLRLADALEAVSLDRFRELTADMSKQIEDVLRHIQRDESALDRLERLVTTLFRNLGLYQR